MYRSHSLSSRSCYWFLSLFDWLFFLAVLSQDLTVSMSYSPSRSLSFTNSLALYVCVWRCSCCFLSFFRQAQCVRAWESISRAVTNYQMCLYFYTTVNRYSNKKFLTFYITYIYLHLYLYTYTYINLLILFSARMCT